MIKSPPQYSELLPDPWSWILANQPQHLGAYSLYSQPTDMRGKYLPFDEFRFRVAAGLDTRVAWAITREARRKLAQPLLMMGYPAGILPYYPTAMIQKAAMLADQATTTPVLEWTLKNLGEDQHLAYLMGDLLEDESISSSQLEGAATTTLVAKDMLKRRREPRTVDERMIRGNFRMMQYAWEQRHADFSKALISDLHRVGTEGIDDASYGPGLFRATNDVVVEDGEGNVVHQPPPAEVLDARMETLGAWINTTHDDINSISFIHPLIKAMCIHFALGFEHPFKDGNGRVARALFYWFLFKKNYGAFRYISISNLLKKANARYARSYLYTETDEMDMTYFIEYQCSIVMRAIAAFKRHCQKVLDDVQLVNQWLHQSDIYRQLSEKQRALVHIAKVNQTILFTARYAEEKLGCSYNTAAAALNGLVELGVFAKQKDGKEWVYRLLNLIAMGSSGNKN